MPERCTEQKGDQPRQESTPTRMRRHDQKMNLNKNASEEVGGEAASLEETQTNQFPSPKHGKLKLLAITSVEDQTQDSYSSASTDGDEDGSGYASENTVLDSDESQASIFKSRSALHELTKDDEMSGAPSMTETIEQSLKEISSHLGDPIISFSTTLTSHMSLRTSSRPTHRQSSSGSGMGQS